MKILVGNTGFVGSNLSSSFSFDFVYNSKNIHEAFGLKPDLCVYSGVKALKFVANERPDEDQRHIEDTKNNLLKIQPKKLVLISTVDSVDCTQYINENYRVNEQALHPYGIIRIKDIEFSCQVSHYEQLRLKCAFSEEIELNDLNEIKLVRVNLKRKE